MHEFIVGGIPFKFIGNNIEINYQENTYNCNYPFSKVTKITEPSKFKVYLFRRFRTIENNIYQVFLNNNDKRIGWLFPITAMTSNEHSFSNNSHFLNYVKSAFCFLIIEILKIENLPSYQIDLLDFYDETIHIFCHSEETLSELDISIYFHDLFSLGFHSDYKSKVKLQIDYPNEPRIYLNPYSKDIVNITYIKNLLIKQLPSCDNPILEFFLFYQIIEMLINQIFLSTKSSLFELTAKSNTVSEARESMYKINDLMSEKTRISILCNKKTNLNSCPSIASLQEACNDFLKNNSLINEDLNDFHEYIYRVRNTIFHTYYQTEYLDDLKTINQHFRKVISFIISNYKD